VSGIKVLMVDDSPEDVALVTATLARYDPNIQIGGVSSTAKCLGALTHDKFDLLVVDYDLEAGEDGLELIKKVKSEGWSLPVIFMTGWGSEEVAAEAFRQGVVDYFVKEVDYSHIARLANSIRNAVAQARAEAEGEQLRRRLEISEQRYRALAESTLEAIIGLREDGSIAFGNSALGRKFGLEPEDSIGLNISHYIKIQGWQNDPSEVNRGFFEKLTGREIQGEWLHPGRRPIPIEFSISPANRISGFDFVLVIRDITTRKRMEAELYQKQMELVQAGKMATLGEMAAGVAHELNQPLNTIRITASRMRRKIRELADVDGFYDEKLELIESQVDRAAGIIEHMRLFGRRPKQEMTAVNVTAAIDGVFTILGEQLRSAGVEVFYEAEEGLPPIMGEQMRLEQVFLNIIGNAREAMESKEKLLPKDKPYSKRLEILAFAEGDSHVAIQFKDNGCGMHEDVVERVFEPFFTTKEVGQGTGLGLSVSYSIVRDLQGKIECSSKEMEGTVFKVILKRADGGRRPEGVSG
jgi:PAS domain S-box-containing protein